MIGQEQLRQGDLNSEVVYSTSIGVGLGGPVHENPINFAVLTQTTTICEPQAGRGPRQFRFSGPRAGPGFLLIKI